MFKKWGVLFLVTTLALAACGYHSPVYNQTEDNVADVKLKATASRKQFDSQLKKQPSLTVKEGMYVDTTPIDLERSPSWLQEHIVIRGDQLPFSYYSRVIAAGAGTQILTKYQTGLDPSTPVTISYSGTIKGALDLLATRSGYVYSIHGNSIYWQAYVTRTFDIAFMPGGTDYLMGKSGGSSGVPGASAAGGLSGTVTSNYATSDESGDEFSSLKGTLSIWKDLENTIKPLLSPGGTVIVSESTTSVTVRDKPSNVTLIGQYINNLNHNMSKQVLVKVQVLEVTLENDYNFGIDWGIVTRAFHQSPFQINANYGTPISITTFTPQANATPGTTVLPQFGTQGNGKTDSYTILLNALNQQGKTSVVSEPRVLCLNNQVCVERIVNTQGYLASVQNTTLGGTTGSTNVNNNTVTSQLTPGLLTTGLTLYILPKILRENIYIQVNADISTAGQFTTVSSGAADNPNSTSIQVPNVTEKHFSQRSMIKSGDTLILSGFRQVVNLANANQFLTSQALGGKGSSEVTKETIVLITPIVLNGSA